MKAATAYAPPFHQGVNQLMNVGDAGTAATSPRPTTAQLLTRNALWGAAGMWVWARFAGRDGVARVAKGATGALAIATIAATLYRPPRRV